MYGSSARNRAASATVEAICQELTAISLLYVYIYCEARGMSVCTGCFIDLSDVNDVMDYHGAPKHKIEFAITILL